jgi:hypothetical protein
VETINITVVLKMMFTKVINRIVTAINSIVVASELPVTPQSPIIIPCGNPDETIRTLVAPRQ